MKRLILPIALLLLAIPAHAQIQPWANQWLQHASTAQNGREYLGVYGTSGTNYKAGANVTFTLLSPYTYSISTAGGGGALQLTGDITAGPGVSPLATTLKNTGTAGTYTKTTFDAQGRETSGSSAALASADYANQGTATTLLHGNAAGNPSWGAVSLANDVTGSLPNASLANSSVTYNGKTVALGASATLGLASADFANQGATTTVLHGNAAGNPAFGAVNLATDVSGALPASAINGVVTNSSYVSGGATNQVYTYAGWSGNPSITNLNTTNISLRKTTSATSGVINQDGVNWMSTFGTANLFLGSAGEPAGNFTLSGSYNMGLGRFVLRDLTSGQFNIGFGSISLQKVTTGVQNMAVGASSLQNITVGSANVAIGCNSLASLAGASANSYEVAIGDGSLVNLATGSGNSAIGRNAGYTVTSGTFNTFIGYSSGLNALQKVNPNNSMALGANAYTTADNQVVIGNATTNVILTGDVTGTGTGTFTNGVASNSRRLLAPVAITVGASPFNFTNSVAGGTGGTNNIFVFVDGAGVTGTVGINGTTIFSAVLGADVTLPLQPGEYCTITYTVGTPVMKWKPF